MKPNRQRQWGVAVILAGLATGCAHREVSALNTPTSTPAPAERTSTTTITAAPARPPTTSNMNVSEEIARACDLHFANVPQAPKFDFDRSELRPDDDDVLAQVATCLTQGPLRGRSIRLVGRADPRGEVEYNLALGSSRAASVATYLSHLGVDSNRIQQTSRGKLDASGTDEASWQRDRRVDLDLL
jgi:peptidoglycan-associated lipoprotein